jgi:superfamily I DNA and/or RNA helicase
MIRFPRPARSTLVEASPVKKNLILQPSGVRPSVHTKRREALRLTTVLPMNLSTECVAAIVAGLVVQGVTWTNRFGQTQPMRLNDILIVAPYNAQVSEISRLIPGARVGTVDKFQGQEAPIVIYSLTTPSPDEAPHGMEFLFSRHRLNVAVSRARCASILVGNPRLFEPNCRSPEQMRMANAFCAYLERAIVRPSYGCIAA